MSEVVSVVSEVILDVLLSLAPHRSDVNLAETYRKELLLEVAEAYASVAKNTDEVAFLISQGTHESHHASAVLLGKCHKLGKYACDPDRDGVPRAVGPLQVWPRYCEGAATLEGQAQCVLKLARGGRAHCKTWEGAFAAQSGLPVCTRPTSKARVATMQRVLRKIHVERQRERAK